MNSSRQIGRTNKSNSHSHSPHDLYHTIPHADTMGNGNTALKPPPTEPRAHKRPRLSDTHASPPRRLPPSLPQKPQTHHHSNLPPRIDVRDQSRQPTDYRGKPGHTKMDVDGDGRAPSPANRNREREKTTRDRERGRERGVKEKERVRDTGKDWDRDANNKPSSNRRNGHMSGTPGRGGGGGGSGAPPGRKGNERSNNGHNSQIAEHASRTLQERLGL